MDFYKKPEKEGLYLLNFGDIVVDSNIEIVNIYKNKNNKLEFIDKNNEVILLDNMNDTSWKWFPALEIFKQIDSGNLKLKKTDKKKLKP